MKTTLQEIIDELKVELDTNIIAYHEISIMKWVIGIIESKLEKENKQIMDSWKEGTKYVMDINDGKVIPPMSAIDYLIYFKTEKSDYCTSFSDYYTYNV